MPSLRHPAGPHQADTAHLGILCQVQQRVQLVTPADVLRLNPLQVGAIVVSCLVRLPPRLVQLGLQGPGPGRWTSAEGHLQLLVKTWQDSCQNAVKPDSQPLSQRDTDMCIFSQQITMMGNVLQCF